MARDRERALRSVIICYRSVIELIRVHFPAMALAILLGCSNGELKQQSIETTNAVFDSGAKIAIAEYPWHPVVECGRQVNLDITLVNETLAKQGFSVSDKSWFDRSLREALIFQQLKASSQDLRNLCSTIVSAQLGPKEIQLILNLYQTDDLNDYALAINSPIAGEVVVVNEGKSGDSHAFFSVYLHDSIVAVMALSRPSELSALTGNIEIQSDWLAAHRREANSLTVDLIAVAAKMSATELHITPGTRAQPRRLMDLYAEISPRAIVTSVSVQIGNSGSIQ